MNNNIMHHYNRGEALVGPRVEDISIIILVYSSGSQPVVIGPEVVRESIRSGPRKGPESHKKKNAN